MLCFNHFLSFFITVKYSANFFTGNNPEFLLVLVMDSVHHYPLQFIQCEILEQSGIFHLRCIRNVDLLTA